jgi:hypothetical protein
MPSVYLLQAFASPPAGAVPLLNNSSAHVLPAGFIAVQPAVFWSMGLGLGFCFAAIMFGAVYVGRMLWEMKRVRVFWRGNAAHTMREEWVKRSGDEFHKRFGDEEGQVLLQPEGMMITGKMNVPTWFIDQTTGLCYVFESNAERYAKNPALEIAAQSNPLVYFDQITLNRAQNIYNADKDPDDWKRGLILPVAIMCMVILVFVAIIGFKVAHLG